MPKKLIFDDGAGEATLSPSPRKLSFPDPIPAALALEAERRPRVICPEPPPQPEPERRPRIIAPAPPPAPSPEPVARPRAIAPVEDALTERHTRAERPRTLTDVLIEQAQKSNPDIPVARLRGRIDTLLTVKIEVLTQWGEVNLAPLQEASKIQADIASELQRIDAIGRLNAVKDSFTRERGFLDRFTAQKTPEQHEFILKDAKRALTDLMIKSDRQRREFFTEVHDLHLDAIALVVTLGEYKDATMANIANSRSKTLLLAHQTGTMLLTVLENTSAQCAQFIEQIESMMSVTIPQWKLASQKR